MTIKSINVVADGSLGLIVTATFQGDVERYLGQGDLANGRAGARARPQDAGSDADGHSGRGRWLHAHAPADREAKPQMRRSVVYKTVELFSPEQVLHVHTPPGAGAVRDSSQIMFYLGPTVLGQLTGIKLKVFARSPAAGGRRAGEASWPAILKTRPVEAATLTVDQSDLSYAQLADPLTALSGIVSSAVEPELRGQAQTAAARATVAAYAAVAKAMSRSHRLPRTSRNVLAADVSRTSLRLGV